MLGELNEEELIGWEDLLSENELDPHFMNFTGKEETTNHSPQPSPISFTSLSKELHYHGGSPPGESIKDDDLGLELEGIDPFSSGDGSSSRKEKTVEIIISAAASGNAVATTLNTSSVAAASYSIDGDINKAAGGSSQSSLEQLSSMIDYLSNFIESCMSSFDFIQNGKLFETQYTNPKVDFLEMVTMLKKNVLGIDLFDKLQTNFENPATGFVKSPEQCSFFDSVGLICKVKEFVKVLMLIQTFLLDTVDMAVVNANQKNVGSVDFAETSPSLLILDNYLSSSQCLRPSCFIVSEGLRCLSLQVLNSLLQEGKDTYTNMLGDYTKRQNRASIAVSKSFVDKSNDLLRCIESMSDNQFKFFQISEEISNDILDWLSAQSGFVDVKTDIFCSFLLKNIANIPQIERFEKFKDFKGFQYQLQTHQKLTSKSQQIETGYVSLVITYYYQNVALSAITNVRNRTKTNIAFGGNHKKIDQGSVKVMTAVDYPKGLRARKYELISESTNQDFPPHAQFNSEVSSSRPRDQPDASYDRKRNIIDILDNARLDGRRLNQKRKIDIIQALSVQLEDMERANKSLYVPSLSSHTSYKTRSLNSQGEDLYSMNVDRDMRRKKNALLSDSELIDKFLTLFSTFYMKDMKNHQDRINRLVNFQGADTSSDYYEDADGASDASEDEEEDIKVIEDTAVKSDAFDELYSMLLELYQRHLIAPTPVEEVSAEKVVHSESDHGQTAVREEFITAEKVVHSESDHGQTAVREELITVVASKVESDDDDYDDDSDDDDSDDDVVLQGYAVDTSRSGGGGGGGFQRSLHNKASLMDVKEEILSEVICQLQAKDVVLDQQYFKSLKLKMLEYKIFKKPQKIKALKQSRSKWIEKLKKKRKKLRKKRLGKEARVLLQIEKEMMSVSRKAQQHEVDGMALQGDCLGIVSGMHQIIIDVKNKITPKKPLNMSKKKVKKIRKRILKQMDTIDDILESFAVTIDE